MAGLVQVLAAPRYGKGTGFAKQTKAGSIARALTQSTAASSTPQQLFQPLSPPRSGALIDTGETLIPAPPKPDAAATAADTTPTPPATPAPQTPAASPTATFEADPVYQQILALTQGTVADAETGALAARKQELIGYGYDPTLDSTGGAKQLFPDESTLLAAQGNPFSTVAGLKRGYEKNLNQIADALNQKNLFYGSARANAEGAAGLDFQGALAQAAGQRDSTLGSIAAALAQAKQAADAQRIGGANDAYNRATAHPTDTAPPPSNPTDPNGGTNDGSGGNSLFPGGPLALEDVPMAYQIALALANAKKTQPVALY